MFTTKGRVEALTLSSACSGMLGTPWETLGRRGKPRADLLVDQVCPWLDYNPHVRQELELEIDKLQSFTMWSNDTNQ